MMFVDYVRYYHKEQEYDDLATTINRAIDRCIEEGLIKLTEETAYASSEDAMKLL